MIKKTASHLQFVLNTLATTLVITVIIFSLFPEIRENSLEYYNKWSIKSYIVDK